MKPFRIAMILTLAIAPLPARAVRPPLDLQPPRPAAPRTGYRAEFLADLDDVESKYLDLANAVPAEKYLWRPSKGVRSISEVYMHVAGSNYLLTTFVGAKPPVNIPKDFEKTTDKQRVMAELQHSFEQLRTVMLTTADAEIEKQVLLFGSSVTERRVFTRILTHLHEHLGQSIAYARMNGVVPPWSRKES